MLWDFEFSMSAYLSGHILGFFFLFVALMMPSLKRRRELLMVLVGY